MCLWEMISLGRSLISGGDLPPVRRDVVKDALCFFYQGRFSVDALFVCIRVNGDPARMRPHKASTWPSLFCSWLPAVSLYPFYHKSSYDRQAMGL